MAWYLNQYVCPECKNEWDDEWSCCCDDICPNCECRHISPAKSIDLTTITEPIGEGKWRIWISHPDAGDEPEYDSVGALDMASSAGMRFVPEMYPE